MANRDRDEKVLATFVQVYCRAHHGTDEKLCEECDELLTYARQRLAECPLDPKPKCKDCPVHCYKPEYRERIKIVMRYAGIHFVKRGRLDWLVRYFLS